MKKIKIKDQLKKEDRAGEKITKTLTDRHRSLLISADKNPSPSPLPF